MVVQRTATRVGSRAEIVAQLLSQMRMPQLCQALGLDLTDTFARDTEGPPNLFQSARFTVGQAVAHPHDLALSLAEMREHGFDVALKKADRDDVGRRDRLGVLDQIA